MLGILITVPALKDIDPVIHFTAIGYLCRVCAERPEMWNSIVIVVGGKYVYLHTEIKN